MTKVQKNIVLVFRTRPCIVSDMESNGKYVRAPKAPESEWEIESIGHSDQVLLENSSSFCSATSLDDCDVDEGSERSFDSALPASIAGCKDQEDSDAIPSKNVPIEPDQTHQSTRSRLQRMENVLCDLSKAMASIQRAEPEPFEPDQDWSTPTNSASVTTSSSVRWDNIKPFPAGVPANQMWEEWNRYIENFEIAATLSNANDPVRRSQLLFLSMGTELQGIVRAAKLRPSLKEANCYRNFVSNIGRYFQSMTDSAAEHEAFSNMKQQKSETAVAFHSRLMAKVRLCGYSPADHDRFVRAQLLKGLRNKDLVKAARTYGHDTNYIVQAATRDEAYDAEMAMTESFESSYSVHRVHRKPTIAESIKNRARPFDKVGRPEAKRFRGNRYAEQRYSQEPSRRFRCRRCHGHSHSNLPCPALNRNCNICGERGHFAAACRRARVRQLQIKSSPSPTRDSRANETQVLND